METEASLVRLRSAAAGFAAEAALPLAKSSLMPDVAVETVVSREMGAVGRVAVAVAVFGKGHILRPYGEDALRRAEVTCSCVRTVDSSRGERGEGAE